MESKPQYDIDIMSNVSNLLESLPDEMRSLKYKSILDSIHNYIRDNCKHEYITDLIDIDVERSQTIQYCKKCYYTIPNN